MHFCIYTYSILNLAINILTTDYGILNHYLHVFTIVLLWIGPSSHDYPHLEPMLSFDTHVAAVLGTGESS